MDISETDEALSKAANDPLCNNRQECLEVLERRTQRKAERGEAEKTAAEAEIVRRAKVRAELVDNPFDPRREVSADAVYAAKAVGERIVTHLWIIFVLLPFVLVLGILYRFLR